MSKHKEKLVVLTGSGISAESGISTFRDAGGLWEGYDVMKVATPEGWKADPAMVLDFYNQRRHNVMQAEPNAAHRALAELEDQFDVTIITQNVDDFHDRGGSTNIVYLHGEILKSRSSVDPELIYDCFEDIHMGDTCEKGSQLRPHVVWFGEPVPMIEKATAIVETADILIVVGTSLEVYPAAGLVNYVASGKPKFLVDSKITTVDYIPDLTCITEKATIGVPRLVGNLKNHMYH